MCIHLNFDYKKATQSLVFFAQKAGGRLNKLKALKLVYFADRYHLRKYGRPITNDEYFAMPFGPVASGVKDLAEMSDFLSSCEREYASQCLLLVDQFTLEAVKPLDQEVFSMSDLEALAYSWKHFGAYTEFQLAELTHAYPEWKKHEQRLKTYSRTRMDLEDFFDNPESPQIDPCFALSAEEKADVLEQFHEFAHVEALWN